MDEFPEGLARADLDAARAAAGEGPLIVALSGGGDSTALLHLLAESGDRDRLIACIVDHGARAGSDRDAEQAAAIAERIGVRARIEKLGSIAKPSQDAWRRARYMRLAEVAHAHGGRAIVAGHTLDDQAETICMRMGRGEESAEQELIAQFALATIDAAYAERLRASRPDWRGLAGMARIAPLPLWPEGLKFVLIRPLLGVRRGALREYLRKREVAWIDDPANDNPKFERVRARQTLADAPHSVSAGMAELAARLRPLAEAEDREAALWLRESVTFDAERVLLRAYGGAARAVRLRGLAALSAAVAGRNLTPEISRVAAVLDELEAGAFKGATFSGVRLKPVKGGVQLCRDSGEVHGRRGRPGLRDRSLKAGETCIWDNRVRIAAHEDLTLTPHGHDTGAPVVLAAEGQEWRLHAAEAQGRVTADWLIEAHISHILFTSP